MMGISYGGISQLFTAADPAAEPGGDLAAVGDRRTRRRRSTRAASSTPASPSSGRRTGPRRRKPAGPDSGPAVGLRADPGGRQDLRGQPGAPRRGAPTCCGRSSATTHYRPKVADPLSPVTFVDKINVPVFMACQWQDEQTGGHCPTLAEPLHRHGQEVVHVHERHPHRLARPGDVQPLVRLPPALRRQARRRPRTRRCSRRAAPVDLPGGDGGLRRDAAAGPDPAAADLRGARSRRSRSCRRSGSCFDNGAGGSSPGQPYPGFEQSFSTLPRARAHGAAPGTLGRAATLERRPAARGGADSFTWDAEARPLDQLQRRHRRRRGRPVDRDARRTSGSSRPAGSAVSYVTEPLERGHDRRRRRRRASLGARPRRRTSTSRRRSARSGPTARRPSCRAAGCAASMRKLDTTQEHAARAGPEPPRKRDVAPLPRGRFVKVTIPLYYQGHAYRAGSRIRVTIAAPERRPADLVVRRDRAEGHGEGRDRPRRQAGRRT